MRMRAPWCVAVTRDEPTDGPLGSALQQAGLTVVHCPAVSEQPPKDPAPLAHAAANLDAYDWAIFSSRRGVDALRRARGRELPATLRTAAVGASTARALRDAGVKHDPVVADEAGADALWILLKDREWRNVRVLIPSVEGGRRAVIDGLKTAGADVTIVEAYRMVPRPTHEVAAQWSSAKPDAVVLASPSAANALIDAVGRDACAQLAAVFAIGSTTADAIRAHGLEPLISPAADFATLARFVADRAASSGPASDRIADADG